jgi:hypothetical protein
VLSSASTFFGFYLLSSKKLTFVDVDGDAKDARSGARRLLRRRGLGRRRRRRRTRPLRTRPLPQTSSSRFLRTMLFQTGWLGSIPLATT